MSEAELAELAADMKANGQLEPATIAPDGLLLDGANRQAACAINGTELNVVTHDGDPVTFSLSKNRHRRHMDKVALAFVCAEMAKLPRGAPPGNANAAKTNTVNTGFVSSLKTNAAIAKAAGIPGYAVEDAKAILSKGSAQVIDLVRAKKAGLRAAADYVRKTPKDKQVPDPNVIKDSRSAKGKRTTTAGDSDAAREVREHVRPLIEQGDLLHVQEVVAATGRSRIIAEAAIAFERGRAEGIAEAGETAAPDPSTLPKTAQEKLALFERRLRAQLEAEFEQRVRDEVKRRLEARDAEDSVAVEQANELIRQNTGRMRPPFTAEQYHQLLWALHPDNRDPAKVTAGFILLRQKKLSLCDEGPIKRKSSFAPMPKTLEELQARKKTRA